MGEEALQNYLFIYDDGLTLRGYHPANSVDAWITSEQDTKQFHRHVCPDLPNRNKEYSE